MWTGIVWFEEKGNCFDRALYHTDLFVQLLTLIYPGFRLGLLSFRPLKPLYLLIGSSTEPNVYVKELHSVERISRCQRLRSPVCTKPQRRSIYTPDSLEIIAVCQPLLSTPGSPAVLPLALPPRLTLSRSISALKRLFSSCPSSNLLLAPLRSNNLASLSAFNLLSISLNL